MPTSIPASRDADYPGTMRLHVDATDLDRRIFRVRQTIPVAAPGPLTLMYPKWLPGNHAPRGPLERVSGLVVRGGGQVLPWSRDPVEVFAYRVTVPAGVTEVEVTFEHNTPTAPEQGRVVVTQEMLNLQWNQTAFYPAGWRTARIPVEASVKLPAGWSYGVALEPQGAPTADNAVTFKPVSFETLVDSPMFAGRYYKRVDLDPGGRSPVILNLVADKPEQLEFKPEQIKPHMELVKQADRLFGKRHFDRYDFLLALTDRMGGIGLEHHRSSENGVGGEYFTDWAKQAPERDLLPHEYTHSWNGKFRRGADLWTPDFHTPMRNSLLWVYEGQTQYWGFVLSARSGLLSKQETLDAIASTAALYSLGRPGRAWRPVQDTVNDPIISARRPNPWSSWQRSEDYYSEGQLVWLEVDTLIREKTGGKRSLDDFAKRFFGAGREGDYGVMPYTIEDVAADLSAVVAHDWLTYLKSKIQDVQPQAPLEGLARGGYRLTFAEEPTDYWKQVESAGKNANLTYSLGAVIGTGGNVTSVLWEGPAFDAGFTIGTQIVAVNGMAYDADRLKTAIKDAKGRTDRPIELIVKKGEAYRTVRIAYHEGLRYPRLERISGSPARLDEILAPRSR